MVVVMCARVGGEWKQVVVVSGRLWRSDGELVAVVALSISALVIATIICGRVPGLPEVRSMLVVHLP